MTRNQALHQTSAPTEVHAVGLSGVPETMLWTLWNRGCEMRRADRLIEDPMAADLVARIDYDFAGRFGPPSVFHPIRARYSDDLVGAYLKSVTEDPVVVALGEGLETQLWRVDDGRVRWVSVELPEAMAVRRQLLPEHPRAALVEASALDPSWMDAVPRKAPPFITAAGLLMYFEEAEVAALLCRIAEVFPGAQIFFDAIPPAFSRRTLRGFKVTRRYTAPPMPWGISIDDIPDFVRRIPRLQVASVQSYADPFPRRTRFYRMLSRVPALRRRFAASLAHLRCRD
ncbi:MAG TPA: class I SAM-dependent methyltransferase [Kiloniellaceae bacterium]|nr:class I SAM-dependent methyltransferase [Kiloniellaceae bacterium]HIP77139.1 class I SAM-dependent methyltransferase [Kiloniellaceae bacterium]